MALGPACRDGARLAVSRPGRGLPGERGRA